MAFDPPNPKQEGGFDPPDPKQEGGFGQPNPRQVVVSEEQRLAEIEGEFAKQDYALDLSETPKGNGWLAAYRRESSTQGTTDGYYGRTKVDAAEAALARFRQEQESRGA